MSKHTTIGELRKNNLGDFAGAMDDYDMAIKLNPKLCQRIQQSGSCEGQP